MIAVAMSSKRGRLKRGSRILCGGERPFHFVVTKVRGALPGARGWFWCEGYYLFSNGEVLTVKEPLSVRRHN